MTDGTTYDPTDAVEIVDFDSDDFMQKVETQWFERCAGDLNIVRYSDEWGYAEMVDESLRTLVEAMASYAANNIVQSGMMQVDANGADLRHVSADEMARRIAVAIDALTAGGVA